MVVNLIAAPGSGKSTMASDIFARLKWRGIDCELISEFAKELVWEQRYETFKDEIYIFAKQNHRLFRVNGKVDVIITDRPIILSMYYNNKYGTGSENLNRLILEEHNRYNNLNIFINRKKDYNPNGRNQTEEESNVMAKEIKNMLDKNDVVYHKVDGTQESVDVIVDYILTHLNYMV